MKDQDCKEYHYEIRRYGCYLKSLLKIKELIDGVDLSTVFVIDQFKKGKRNAYINEDCFIGNPDKVLKCVNNKNVYQIGKNNIFWGWVKNKYGDTPSVNFIITEFETKNLNSHFIMTYPVYYDPANNKIELTGIRKSEIYYRIFE